VLYAREGNWGNAGIIEVNDPIAISQRVMLFSPDIKQIVPNFLKWVLNSPQVRKLASEKKRGYTAIHITVADAKKFPVPLPPLPEQRRIDCLPRWASGKGGALRRLQAETGAELDALMPAVLDRAFKGEL
jgi:type I restriction enzyme S subunit